METWILVAIIAGIVVFLIILAFIFWYLRRKQRKEQAREDLKEVVHLNPDEQLRYFRGNPPTTDTGSLMYFKSLMSTAKNEKELNNAWSKIPAGLRVQLNNVYIENKDRIQNN